MTDFKTEARINDQEHFMCVCVCQKVKKYPENNGDMSEGHMSQFERTFTGQIWDR